jgi:hypothetical protein
MSFTYSFPAIIKTLPSLSIPYQDRAVAEGELHISTIIGSFTNSNTALFRSECDKHIIILDCVNAFHNYHVRDGQEPILPDAEDVEACYIRLMSWWRSRPPSLDPEHAPSQANLLCA